MKSYKKEKFKNKEDWKTHHTKFLGGSSAGVLLGVSKWKTKIELYNQIISENKNEHETSNENIDIGIYSEPLIRKLFAINSPNFKVINPKGWESYISKKYPFLGATVDGILIDKNTGVKGILEIKTADIRRRGDIEEWEDQIPMQYYCQILHYLMVMEDCQFVKLVAQLRMFDWRSELDNKVVELRTIIRHIERKDVESDIEKLRKIEIDFWKNHIETKIPPDHSREIGG